MSASAFLASCKAASDLYPAIETALDQLIGHKLFTLMAIDWPRGEAARIYTNEPKAYPVGGRKPLGDLTAWGKIVLEDRQPWIAYTAEDIEGAFFDHAVIASLGCASCLNVPVVDEAAPDGPRVIGTLNMLHEARHFEAADAEAAAPFAALLVEPYRAWASS